MKFELLVFVILYIHAASSCYEPTGVSFRGHASSACCEGKGLGKGYMGESRRYYGLAGDSNKCQTFHDLTESIALKAETNQMIRMQLKYFFPTINS